MWRTEPIGLEGLSPDLAGVERQHGWDKHRVSRLTVMRSTGAGEERLRTSQGQQGRIVME